MPKIEYTISITTDKPIPNKDADDFVKMAFQNHQQRFSPESEMANATIEISSPVYSEKVGTVDGDDQSGTIDSEDLKNDGPDAEPEGGAVSDVEDLDPDADKDKDKGGTTSAPPSPKDGSPFN
jgi:hypothetical protein